jgi:hypothetical protein
VTRQFDLVDRSLNRNDVTDPFALFICRYNRHGYRAELPRRRVSYDTQQWIKISSTQSLISIVSQRLDW